MAFNNRHFLPACLDSLVAQSHPSYEIILVDNGSTDGGPDFVAETYPDVVLVRNGENLGFVGGNNAGFAVARGELVALANQDTEADPGWLAALDAALVADAGLGMVTSRITLFGDREHLNACGNDIHVSGLGFCRGLGEPAGSRPVAERVASISGCAFMIRRELLDAIGGFDETFFNYVEDTDLSVRASLHGSDCGYVPGSLIHHHYELRMRPDKFFHLERNRHLLHLKNLRLGTLVALAPALILSELMMWAFAVLRGGSYVRAKLRADAWVIQNRHSISASRSRVQRLRTRGDGQLLRLMTGRLSSRQVIGDAPLAAALGAVAGAAFSVLLAVARLFVR